MVSLLNQESREPQRAPKLLLCACQPVNLSFVPANQSPLSLPIIANVVPGCAISAKIPHPHGRQFPATFSCSPDTMVVVKKNKGVEMKEGRVEGGGERRDDVSVGVGAIGGGGGKAGDGESRRWCGLSRRRCRCPFHYQVGCDCGLVIVRLERVYKC